ncbi:MAG: nucleotidyltransferase domain-containing protein [Cyclobacteriaceae bacterium]
MLTEEIAKQKKDFENLCANHKVKYLYAFGSSITNRFDPEKSDIDLLVEMDIDDPIERGENLLSLWDTLENFFNKKVDLLTYLSIRNPYLRKHIDSTKVLIYDGLGKKVLV